MPPIKTRRLGALFVAFFSFSVIALTTPVQAMDVRAKSPDKALPIDKISSGKLITISPDTKIDQVVGYETTTVQPKVITIDKDGRATTNYPADKPRNSVQPPISAKALASVGFQSADQTDLGAGTAKINGLTLLMPVPNGKLSSPWGWRVHPVLGFVKFHRGVDWSAPRGSKIYAAADGIVEDVGWRGNYGRYMRIAHSGPYETAYGHMDGFAPGLAAGSHVKKGQVIGYVGRSGLASGNHLYFEVLVGGKQINPFRAHLVMVSNHVEEGQLADGRLDPIAYPGH
jgi:murein DD-endopeptidase MepM/ murein hydrolase activator NlpD